MPLRRYPLVQKQIIDKEIDKMLEDQIIEPSKSQWSANICSVRKKDGSPRFCIDFRKLNFITQKDAYPLPRIDETLDTLSGQSWFCTLDLASGYWQIKMDEKDKLKTAFTSHRGLFHFTVMPFGLTNTPVTFERLMDSILKSLTWKKCLCYLDDVIIFGNNFENTHENLRQVFIQLRAAHLKLKAKKCLLFQKRVPYLGHVISESGVECDPSKVEVIENWPQLKSKRDVRSFLALAGYYRRFIQNFLETAGPLTQLTRKLYGLNEMKIVISPSKH
jgi:hypothetical protein